MEIAGKSAVVSGGGSGIGRGAGGGLRPGGAEGGGGAVQQWGGVGGGGSGIGRATCVALAQAGAKVVVADIDERGGAETVDLCGAAGGIAVFRHCDVTHTEDIASAFACAFEHFGSFDIVHNNAGIGGGGSL